MLILKCRAILWASRHVDQVHNDRSVIAICVKTVFMPAAYRYVGESTDEVDEGVDVLYISYGTDQDHEVSLARTMLLRRDRPGS